MGWLARLEQRLERSGDALFGRVFGGRLSPRAIVRAVEDAVELVADGDGRRQIANAYRVALHPADHQTLAPKLAELARRCREAVQQRVEAKGWPRPARLRIVLEPDEHVAASAVTVSASYDPRPGAAELVATDGGRRVALAGRPVLIGREAGCDLELAASEVSRQHARLEFRDGQYVICDLGSANGTTINGASVAQAPLRDGDVLGFGPVTFTFRET
jgi:hypothetical protein